jgi:hypothetical protein
MIEKLMMKIIYLFILWKVRLFCFHIFCGFFGHVQKSLLCFLDILKLLNKIIKLHFLQEIGKSRLNSE